MEKKFELIKEDSIEVEGRTLYRIQALKDFEIPIRNYIDEPDIGKYSVTKGQIGGYVEKEENLSHEGGCWILQNAKAYGNALVKDNAHLYGWATISGDSVIGDYCQMSGRAVAKGQSTLLGCTQLNDKVIVNDSTVNGNISLYGFTTVREKSELTRTVNLCGSVVVKGAKIIGPLYLNGPFNVSFDIKGEQGIAAYRTTQPIEAGARKSEDFATSTTQDIWECDYFKGTGEELLAFIEKICPDSLGYYKNLVEYHKKQYNL